MELTLRPLLPGDEESAVRWGADEEFCLAIDWPTGLPAAHIRQHWQGLLTLTPPELLRHGIELDGVLVGYTDLAHFTEHSAEFGIAIGERELWGQRLGLRAGQLTLAHAFTELGLKTVTAEAHAPNLRSRALMLRLGFTEIGFGGLEDYQGQEVQVVRFVLHRENFSL
ncbi:GNAT family N-acetyltransferase [Deinococcus arenicola]|uniref:GNAT family protein n=1 Tax=Deinococcus arenicola TaxID=2994950 RepID=A0ABU4DN49_9DEIO|nr:GNAT family protein [Deinococcus sp. ZS9-10]MDV6373863.1 GNAT family protein [Deinococcus sp. ZS9-10]